MFWQVNLMLTRSVQNVTDCLLRKLEQRAQIKTGFPMHSSAEKAQQQSENVLGVFSTGN